MRRPKLCWESWDRLFMETKMNWMSRFSIAVAAGLRSGFRLLGGHRRNG